jgi:hypothetical protein
MKRLQESRRVEISPYGLNEGSGAKPPLLLYFNSPIVP